MKTHSRKLLPIAAALVLFGNAGTAAAQAYGYSYDNIYGLSISNPTGTVTPNTTTDISRATATLNGTNVITGGTGTLDAPQAAVGAVTIGSNNFTQQTSGASDYSRGDAQIVSTQFPAFPAGSTTTQAVGAAESNLAGTGTADSAARNGSTTGLSVVFDIASPTATLAFSFQANPYMEVSLSGTEGSSVTANLATTFTITNNSTGATVFNWAPDGEVGSGIFGGTETADGANLNINLSASSDTGSSPFAYDPTGCGAPGGTGVSSACGGAFSATSNALAVGRYTLTLNSVQSVDATNLTTAVPEPGSIMLFLTGLAAIGYMKMRRQG
jgi:hypothetical protein